MKLSTPKTDEEIRAHAEKREYEKFVYFTNQTLQKIADGILALNSKHEQMFAKHQSLHNNLSIAFENHVRDMTSLVGRTFTSIDEFRSDLGEIETEVEEKLSANRHYITKDDMDRFCDYMLQQHKLLDMSFKRLEAFVESKLNLIKGYVDEKDQRARKDLKPDEKKNEALKEEFDARLEAFKIDFQGVLQEIARMKHAIGYGEKKFENIYTLIERLKESK